MPSTVKEERRVDGPTNHGEEICHIVTEEDPDTALCGKDVTGWPWNPPWPYCVVCLDLMHGAPVPDAKRHAAPVQTPRGARAGGVPAEKRRNPRYPRSPFQRRTSVAGCRL